MVMVINYEFQIRFWRLGNRRTRKAWGGPGCSLGCGPPGLGTFATRRIHPCGGLARFDEHNNESGCLKTHCSPTGNNEIQIEARNAQKAKFKFAIGLVAYMSLCSVSISNRIARASAKVSCCICWLSVNSARNLINCQTILNKQFWRVQILAQLITQAKFVQYSMENLILVKILRQEL